MPRDPRRSRSKNAPWLCLLLAFRSEAGSLNPELAEFGFSLGRTGLTALLAGRSERRGEKLSFTTLRARIPGRKLDLELQLIRPLPAGDARLMGERTLEVIARQYRPQKTPYPGELTHSSRCSAAHQPKIKTKTVDSLELRFLTGLASEREAFGACEKDSARKLGTIASFFVASSRTLVEARVFGPLPFTSEGDLESLWTQLGRLP